MRIAIIAPPWVPIPPPCYGGTEVVLDCLARGLQAAGHDVLLCTTGDSTCPVPISAVLPEAAGTVGMTPAVEFRHVIHAYEAALDWGADVVHDHTLVGPVYGARFPMPIVTTNHGPFASDLGDYYRAIGSTVPIVAISQHHAASAGTIPIAATIHHGVDVDEFPVGGGTGDYALFLGRMCPDKGVHTAIRIARAAQVPLRIAAKLREPAEYDYFRAQVEPGLGGCVEYVGEVGGQDKIDLLANARCLLNPICWPEPFGMVMIEALACGTPVVATPCGSVPEIVTDGATGYVRPTETDLVDMLFRVGSLDREACRQDAGLRFSTERMVADHVDLYQQAIATQELAPAQAA